MTLAQWAELFMMKLEVTHFGAEESEPLERYNKHRDEILEVNSKT